MTEAEWLASDNPERMLQEVEYVLAEGSRGTSPRALRQRDWLCVECSQMVLHLLTDEDVKRAIEWNEATAGRGYLEEPEAWEEHYRAVRAATDCDGFDEQVMAPYVVEEAWAGDFRSVLFHLIRHFPVGLPADTPARLAGLLRCIFGNPFRPVAVDPWWLTSTVVTLARGIYDDRDFDHLPILADALQDAGCDNDSVLSHCRDAGPHARGCWVVDLLLGKA